MFTTFWGEQQAAVGNRRGGLYFYTLTAEVWLSTPEFEFHIKRIKTILICLT
jgi:hypothetical protein